MTTTDRYQIEEANKATARNLAIGWVPTNIADLKLGDKTLAKHTVKGITRNADGTTTVKWNLRREPVNYVAGTRILIHNAELAAQLFATL